MAKVKTWTQCTFSKGENTFTQAWIDSEAAIVSKLVRLITLDDEVWKVTSTGRKVDKLPPFTFKNNI